MRSTQTHSHTDFQFFKNIKLNFPHYFISLKTNFHHNILVILLFVNCSERGEFGIIFKICKRREGRGGEGAGGRGGRVLTATGEEEEEDSPASLLPPPAVTIQPSSVTPGLTPALTVLQWSCKEIVHPIIPSRSPTKSIQ